MDIDDTGTGLVGPECVAEGIEEEEQFRLLADRDCDVVQGYLFSRPLPADVIAQLLTKRTLKTA